MRRLTKIINKTAYLAEDADITRTVDGYTGEAIERLAAYESFHETLLKKHSEMAAEMESLRAKGQVKSVKFRELLARKAMNANVLSMLETESYME